ARNMLAASGCPTFSEIPKHALHGTLIIDALLGTGVRGAVTGKVAEWIRAINDRFPHAIKVAVDLPSGFPTDEVELAGEYVKVHHTVTFTALKRSQAFSPSYEAMGNLSVYPIGTPDDLCEANAEFQLRLATIPDLQPLF